MTFKLPASYWAATAVPAIELGALTGAQRAEVSIVGGGFTGLSTALHLAASGVSVVLLDAAEPGWGASGRNGGQIIPGFKAERHELIKRLGEEQGERLFTWSGTFVDETLAIIDNHSIDCQAGRPGWIQPAHSQQTIDDFRRRTEVWQARGADIRSLDSGQMAALLGTDWYAGGVLDMRGGRLHPLSYARGLAKAATAAGARIHSGSAVKNIARTQSCWTLETASGTVLSDKVVLCTNAYSSSFSKLWPKLATSVVPILSYMVATRPLPDKLRQTILPQGHTAADLKRLTNHFRVESDGRFLFGGRGGLSDGDDQKNSAYVIGKLYELFPKMKSVPLEFYWSGKVALTMDHLPHIHELAPGVWAALGCNGRGVGMCSALGRVLTRLVASGDTRDCPIPITTLKSIPFHRMRLPAMHAAVWWKGAQDTREHRVVKRGTS
jgi:glycine/D-amino acid oxidase-like deaminating enzyme